MIPVAPVMSAGFGVLVVVILGYESTGWYDGENLGSYPRELQETIHRWVGFFFSRNSYRDRTPARLLIIYMFSYRSGAAQRRVNSSCLISLT